MALSLVVMYKTNFGYSVLFVTSATCFALAYAPLLFVEKLKIPSTTESLPKRSFKIIQEKWFALSCLSGTCHFIFEAQLYAYLIFKSTQQGVEHAIPTLFTTHSITLITLGFFWVTFMKNTQRHFFWISVASLFSLISIIAVNWVTSATALIGVAILFGIGEFISPQTRLDYASNSNYLDKLSAISLHNFFTGAIGMSLGFSLEVILRL